MQILLPLTDVALRSFIGAATEGQSGLVELATSAETTTGTDTTRAVTPAGLAAKLPAGTALSVARYAASGTALEAAPLTVDAQGNAILGSATPGTSAQRALVLATGVAPSGSHPADAVQLWVADLAAGNAALRVRSEGGQLYTFGGATLEIGQRLLPLISVADLALEANGGASLALQSNAGSALNVLTTGGTLAAPAVTPTQSTLFAFNIRGHDGTASSTVIAAQLRFRSEEAFSAGFGTYLEIRTGRLGSATAATEKVRITAQGNLRLFNGVGASPVEGTNAEGVIVLKSGVAPTAAHPADAVQAWAADRGATAGKSSLHVRTEDGTSHVLGDRVGLGTVTPGGFCDIAGTTNITTGELQTAGARVNYTLAVYAAGTAYALTAAPALLDFGTTDPSLVLDKAGTYLLSGRVALRYTAATFAANRTVTLKIRRTNNTAADIANSPITLTTAIVTTITEHFAVAMLQPVVYTTAATDDILQLFGSIDVVPSAGSLDAFEASLVATRLY